MNRKTGNAAIDAQEILYDDGKVILCGLRGTGIVNAYKNTDYSAPLTGRTRNGWLCCGAWKRVIIGFRETEVYGREPRVARTLEDLAALLA